MPGGYWAIDVPKLGEQVLNDARLETHDSGGISGPVRAALSHCKTITVK